MRFGLTSYFPYYVSFAGNRKFECFSCRRSCIPFLFATVVFIVLAAIAHKKRINMSALGIGVDFLQIISIFTSFDFQWPVSLKKLFAVASATTYNDQLVAPECSVKTWTFELKWYVCLSIW